jgi:ribose 5-phosphate isomerase A
MKNFKEKGFDALLRKKDGENFLSDGGNFIADLNMGKINKPDELNKQLKVTNGIIETGLFVNIPDYVIAGYKNEVKVLENNSRTF